VNLEMFVTWIVVGLLTGWLLSFVLFGAPSEAGRAAMAVAAFVGAALMTVLQRKIWPSRTLRSVRTTDG
jgi:uncharacterized membrane protein YeaQ/YmgE (transglycosylase-associated protein family)